MIMNQLKSLETTLAGALRREQMAETSIKRLEAEIEQLNRLVWSKTLSLHTLKKKKLVDLLNCQVISYISGSSKRGRDQEHQNDAQVSGRQDSKNGITFG